MVAADRSSVVSGCSNLASAQWQADDLPYYALADTDSPPLKASATSVPRASAEKAENRFKNAGLAAPLPDLTPRLMEYGVHNQYLRWRDDYMKWRQGCAKGSKGEVNIVTLEEAAANDKDGYTFWYPDQASFQFRQTVSYWIAVFCFEGAVLFALCGAFGWSGYMELWPRMTESLSDRPLLVGATCFLLSTYLSVFEMLNLGIKADQGLRYFGFNWAELHSVYGVEIANFAAVWIYFTGAIMYQVSLGGTVVFDFLGLTWPTNLELPLMLGGGACFTLGGVCECIYNEVWHLRWHEVVWWVCILDLAGGVLYFLSAWPFSVAVQSAFAVIGSLFFCTVGCLQLVMWRGGQFGLALFSQLNKVAESKGLLLAQRAQDGALGLPADAVDDVTLRPRNFSARGLFFMFVYIFGSALSLLNCCFGGGKMNSEIRDLSMSIDSIIYAVVLHLVLLLHSAGFQRLPKEQPFRILVAMLRVIALVMVTNAGLNFAIFVREAIPASTAAASTSFD
mmetsp:Transcript_45064/g.107081  ORF Transcript_45064/g.107081 Transcript_45064/m.107081 type:complete len:507 (-) Transcript_45064:242-1762(-)